MGLALVVVEEDARRAVHLRHDHPLRAVDDERAVLRHQRHVAHIDVLLLDVLDRLGPGVLVDLEHDQTQRHLQRGGIGHAPLLALVDVVFRRLELVSHELQHRLAGEIADRENRLEHGLQPFIGAATRRLGHLQKLVVRLLLNLDQIRHFSDFGNVPEELANALAADERLRHHVSFVGVVLKPWRRLATGPFGTRGKPPG